MPQRERDITVILLDAAMKGTKISHANWMGIVLCTVASGFFSSARILLLELTLKPMQ